MKIGNKIRIKAPINTPYGEATYEVDVLITEASLQQLIKDGIVEKRVIQPEPPKIPTIDRYKPFIRRLARKLEVSYPAAEEFLAILKVASPYAHNCLMIDLMADVMNRGKEFGQYVFTVNLKEGEQIRKVFNKNVDQPKFASFDDVVKASILITPFVLEARHGKSQD